MISEEISIYNKYKNPPEWAKREIKGGRLVGMTDINPQWRIDCLTELFGLCGIGWKVEIQNQWVVDAGDSEKIAFVSIMFQYKYKDVWSHPIQANGGAMLVQQEKNGLHKNDEAFKMAYTDAISVACKMIGIGASVYYGIKYRAVQQINTVSIEKEKITEEQQQKIYKLIEDEKIDEETKEKTIEWLNKGKSTKQQAEIIISRLEDKLKIN